MDGNWNNDAWDFDDDGDKTKEHEIKALDDDYSLMLLMRSLRIFLEFDFWGKQFFCKINQNEKSYAKNNQSKSKNLKSSLSLLYM